MDQWMDDRSKDINLQIKEFKTNALLLYGYGISGRIHHIFLLMTSL